MLALADYNDGMDVEANFEEALVGTMNPASPVVKVENALVGALDPTSNGGNKEENRLAVKVEKNDLVGGGSGGGQKETPCIVPLPGGISWWMEMASMEGMALDVLGPPPLPPACKGIPNAIREVALEKSMAAENDGQKAKKGKVVEKNGQKKELKVAVEKNGQNKADGKVVVEKNGQKKEELKVVVEKNGQKKEELKVVVEKNGQKKEELKLVVEKNGQKKEELKVVVDKNGQNKADGKVVVEKNGQNKADGKVVVEKNSQKEEVGKVVVEKTGQKKKLGKDLVEKNGQKKEEVKLVHKRLNGKQKLKVGFQPSEAISNTQVWQEGAFKHKKIMSGVVKNEL